MTLQQPGNAVHCGKILTLCASLAQVARCPFSVQCDILLMMPEAFCILSCIFFPSTFFKVPFIF